MRRLRISPIQVKIMLHLFECAKTNGACATTSEHFKEAIFGRANGLSNTERVTKHRSVVRLFSHGLIEEHTGPYGQSGCFRLTSKGQIWLVEHGHLKAAS
jgi:hypothetical protein